MYTEFGNLTVRAYTAGGGLPVADAIVRINGAEEANRFVTYTLFTNRDGSTEAVSLPAPPKSSSLSPGSKDEKYAIYNMEVEKEGYYRKSIRGVAVFSGISSLQLVNMIPVSKSGSEEYPRGSLNTVIRENEHL